jgi:cyclic pyranopterin phosphate synthase
MGEFSHLDEKGDVRMVDVSAKEQSVRTAVAAGYVTMPSDLVALLQKGTIAKGNVLAVAKTAGIMAAKRTADLIPLCHPLLLDHVDVVFEVREDGVDIRAEVRLRGRTGAEMEALTAVTVSALTIYDMCKGVNKRMVLGNIRLLEKSGGKSGTFRADGAGVDRG